MGYLQSLSKRQRCAVFSIRSHLSQHKVAKPTFGARCGALSKNTRIFLRIGRDGWLTPRSQLLIETT